MVTSTFNSFLVEVNWTTQQNKKDGSPVTVTVPPYTVDITIVQLYLWKLSIHPFIHSIFT